MPYNMARPLVFFLVIGILAADICLGYHYRAPQKKYVPSYRYGDNSAQYGSTLSSLGSETIVSSTLSPLSGGSNFESLASTNIGYDGKKYIPSYRYSDNSAQYGPTLSNLGSETFVSSTLSPLSLGSNFGSLASTNIGYDGKKYIPSYRYSDNSAQYGPTLSNLGSETIVSSTLNPLSLKSNFGNIESTNIGFDGFGTGKFGSEGYGSDSLSISNVGSDSIGTTNLGSSYSDLGAGYYPSFGSSGINSGIQPLYQYTGNSVLNNGYQTQYTPAGTYQTTKDQSSYQIQQQPTQVFKHFYVHAAPEEPEEPQPRTPIVLPPAQKHYKIIFVKTPTESRRTQTVIPVQPQNEEKTIVYVLVKKPEEEQELIVPKVEQKPPSKPEVFFIKYKNKEDSQSVIDNIVKDYNKDQEVSVDASALSDDTYNSASGIADGTYSAATGVADGTYSSVSNFNSGVSDAIAGVTTGPYNSGSSTTLAAINNDNSFTAVSAYDNQYDIPTQSEASVSSNFNGYSGYNLASANSGSDFSEANIASSVASPITVSTTASSIGYDAASAISTSQGVPHETYGVPKFRVK